MKAPNIQTTRVALPQIYAYTTPTVPDHNGWIKIGYTEQDHVEDRIKQQCHTADIAWALQWRGNAVFEGSNETFTDKAFHAYLNKLGYTQKAATEWFQMDKETSRNRFYRCPPPHGLRLSPISPILIVPLRPICCSRHQKSANLSSLASSQTQCSFSRFPAV